MRDWSPAEGCTLQACRGGERRGGAVIGPGSSSPTAVKAPLYSQAGTINHRGRGTRTALLPHREVAQAG